MGIFEKRKIALLRDKIEAIKLDAHNNGRFSLFDTKFSNDFLSKKLTYEQLTNFYDIITNWDKHCNLPYEVGISIDKLATDNTVMIHRTHLGIDKNTEGYTDNNTLYNIMTEGLKNYGHLNAVGGGAYLNTIPDLTLTMTPLDGITGYINLIGSYKSNDVTIITAFPKELVNEHGRIKGESNYYAVYDLSEEPPKVKPEYMIGAILKKNNGLDEFYSQEEIIKLHNANKVSNIK